MTPNLHADFLSQSKSRRYLLGISGGRDSVAMFQLLLKAGYDNLVLCHLNHGLRAKESDQDAAFVRSLAKCHDLPCEIVKVDVGRRAAENGESMELAARRARHRFFSDCAQQYRCRHVLLAHHADDQAETILFNLLRGSSGLKGMQFSSVHEVDGRELIVLRPLLHVPRQEIDQFLTTHNIQYREDATNAEAVATRNRLRNEAIPLLNEIMGKEIRPSLLRAEQLSQARQAATLDMLDTFELYDPQGRLFLPKVLKLAPALQSEVVHSYLKKHEVADISSELLGRCLQLVGDSSIFKINLPGGRYLRCKEKRIFID